MKTYLSSILFLLAISFGYSQENGITYQAVIYEPSADQFSGETNSVPMVNSDICIQFSLIDLAGNVEYEEVIDTTTDEFGMVNLVIGSNEQTNGYVSGFEDVLWDGFDKFLKVGLDLSSSCSRFEEISYQRFNYVPLAYNAKNAERVTGIVPIANGGTGGTTREDAKINLGLNNVENTSDENKPISNATQIVLDVKEDKSNKSFDVAVDAASDVKYPTVKAVKAYVDANLSSGGATLAAEVSRATLAEEAIADNLDVEVDNRMAADAMLQSNIDALETSSNAAITAVQADVDANEVATTNALDLKSDLDSPIFTGTPILPTGTTAITQSLGDNSNALATTAYVVNSISGAFVDLTSDQTVSGVKTFSQDLNVNGRSYLNGGLTTQGINLANGTSNWELGLADGDLRIHQGGCCDRFRMDSGGRVGIGGNYSPSYQLDVQGNGRFTSALTADSFVKTGGMSSEFLKADGSVDNTVYAPLDSPTFSGAVSGITKTMVGLDNVDNTADTDKPVSTATQMVLDLKANIASPTLTGTPLAPTASAGTNTTQIATTAFVRTEITDAGLGDLSTLTTTAKSSLVAAINEVDSNTDTNTAIIGSLTNLNTASKSNLVSAINEIEVTVGNNINDLGSLSSLTTTDKSSIVAAINENRGEIITIQDGVNDAIIDADTQFDAIRTNVGLDTDGKYLANTNTNYMKTSTSMVDATEDLDTQVKINADNIMLKANLASPTLTGTPLAPTAAAGTNTTQIATTAFVTAAASSSNFVDLTSNQSIAGAKTFTDAVTASSFVKSGGTSAEYLMADGSTSSGPSGVLSGSGSTNYLPKFTGSSTLGNSRITDNGTNVGIGTNNPTSLFQVGGEGTTDLNLKFDAVSNTSAMLKLGYRAYQWRIKTKTNSGTLDPLVFSYYNGTTDVERLTITNTGINIPDNLTVTGTINGSTANLSSSLNVNNLFKVSTANDEVNVLTSKFQIGGNGNFDNPLKYEYGGEAGTLKFGYRTRAFRITTRANSGVLDRFIFSYYNGSTDVESMRISNSGIVTINSLQVSGGNPGNGKVLTSDANGLTSWTTPSTTATAYSGVLPISNGGTGSATQNFVDLTSDQSIAGAKTFTGTPLAPTATAGTNTTQIATTAFVANAVSTATSGNFVDLTTAQTIAGTKTFSSDLIVNGIEIGRGIGDNDQNTAVGNSALGTGTGSRNSAFGNGALRNYSGTGFDNNTSVGYNNLPGLTTGSGNTSMGAESMMALQTGTSNTSIGNQSLINTTGNKNVGVGKGSGSTITTGSNNTIIGTEANVLTDGQNNSTAIGYQAVVASDNSIQLGNTAITDVKTSGKLTTGEITIPNTDGTSGQVLATNGTGTLSWSTPIAVREVADEFSATAAQTSFTLTQPPSANSKVKMYVNGIRISNAAYSVSGTTLTYVPANNGGYALTAGDRIQMDFYY